MNVRYPPDVSEFVFSSVPELLSFADQLERTDTLRRGPNFRDVRNALLGGTDLFGDAYCRLRSGDDRRELGITLTPAKIVESMIGWAKERAIEFGSPVRVIDPGAGTGRFAIAAAFAFPKAKIIAIEANPDVARLLRANVAVLGIGDRVSIAVADFRDIALPQVSGPTIFIGNPPYVRHHCIEPHWKRWYSTTCAKHGIAASQLAGLHLHFFAKVADVAHKGDFGCFITAAEWLDVNYGSALRKLLSNGLGGQELHVLTPTAEAFPGTMTTAAITSFAVGRSSRGLKVRSVTSPAGLNALKGGRVIPWHQIAETPRWSMLIRRTAPRPHGFIELGELCRVHRGQVTGANRVWIAGGNAHELPDHMFKAAITSAKEIIEAAPVLDDDRHLKRVIDLPRELDELTAVELRAVERFLQWAKRAGAADSYIARHRKPWWSVSLADPAPIICTYMARRAPVFVRNRIGARLLNIAHGIYPREPLSEYQLQALLDILRRHVTCNDGRVYSGGLVKFEPRELERVLIPRPEGLNGRA